MWFYFNDDKIGCCGYCEIDVGLENEIFCVFLLLLNFVLGYNESKIIEVVEVIKLIVINMLVWLIFENGYYIC